ncbi:MAG: DUF4062 domain-containing protein [Candidatus Aminicenantales bacterium]
MPISRQPSVFVSSTCYDLAQVRNDLRLFFESLGMLPVLSEFPSFPVDPSLDAVGNCLAGVKERADIFILVVGGRYGSVAGGGKSITNLEYLEAKAKGIPRYVFVQKPILNTLPIWRKNPTGDFSGLVDSPSLFEFVESLRDPKENWIFPFESAQDIIEILRIQLAYLFMDSLAVRLKVLGSGLSDALADLSGAALMIAVQKLFAWEYILFSQVLLDEVSKLASVKKDLEYGLVLGRAVRLTEFHLVVDWVQGKLGELGAFAKSANKLVNTALPEALGAPGEPGDPDAIVYVARRLGEVYRRILEWTAEFKRTQVKEEFIHLLEIIARASANMIQEIETFSIDLRRRIGETVRRYEETKAPQSLEMTLTLTCPDLGDLGPELRRLAVQLGFEYKGLL